MVTRLSLLFALLLAPVAFAEDLVPRVLSLVWSGQSGPPADFTVEILKTELAQDGSFLVAEGGETADATLSLQLISTKSLSVDFQDSLDPSKDWKLILPVSGVTTKALRAALATLAPRWKQALAPLPPKVREVYTEKIVQETVVNQTQKGVTVTLRGRPGTEVRFPDGTTQSLSADGELVLLDQIQGSSLVIDTSLPGAFDRHVEASVGTADLVVDITLVDRQRWAVALGMGSSELWHATIAYRLGSTGFHALGGVSTFWPSETNGVIVVATSNNPLNLPLGPLPVVQWLQPEVGVLWYGSRPGDFLEWGVESQATLRFDAAPDGWELSRWFPVGFRAAAVVGVRFANVWSVDVNLGSWLAYSGTDLTQINVGTSTYSDAPIEKMGYSYSDSATDLVPLVSGALYLRPVFVWVDLRYWF